MTGLLLAQYRIDAELGRGGMGIVYRATDTKLNRTVAVKVLPPAALASEDDRARFFREAQAAAQLHHPNIATVFGIDEAAPLTADGRPVEGQSERRPFIAMEFIEGETLQARIVHGPMKLADVVAVGRQVADALKAAHAKEIVHRDIKSANVMLTKDGIAKVLDFGLAKTNQSTMLTRMGSTLGTVAYMSPEQARGQEVDGRSDLYSLGTMLYEMVTGRLPFAGDYEQAVVYGILNEDPEPVTALRTGVPLELEAVVMKLLRKEARLRYQSAADLIADLESVRLGSGTGQSAASLPPTRSGPARIDAAGVARWRRYALWFGFVGLLLGSLFTAAVLTRSARSDVPALVDVSLDVPGMEALLQTYVRLSDVAFALSPDGRLLAYQGLESESGLLLRDLTSDRPVVKLASLGVWPVFSPDSRQVAWTSEGSLLVGPAGGGVARVISTETPDIVGISWADDGRIYLAADYGVGITRLSPEDGVQEMLTAPDSSRGEIGHVCPSLLPDGETLLYQVYGTAGWELAMSNLESGRKVILGPGICPRFAEPDQVFYNQGYRLLVARLDLGKGLLEPARTVTTELMANLQAFTAYYAVSRRGDVVVVEDSDGEGSGIWYTRWDGTREEYRPDVFDVEQFSVSPDGRTIAIAAPYPAADPDIYLFDRETRDTRRIASSLTYDAFPVWAPDGALLFSSERRGQSDIYRVPPGSDQEQLLSGEKVQQYVGSVSRDGIWVGFETPVPGRSTDLFYVAMDGSTEPMPLVSSSAAERDVRFSPREDLVAYLSDETGTSEVYVVDFPPRSPRERITVGGGDSPRWSADGRSLFFVSGSTLYRVAVGPSGRRTGEPVKVLDGIWGDFELVPDNSGVLSITVEGRRTIRYIQRAADRSEAPEPGS